MKYIDTGSRLASDTVGSWLAQEAKGVIREFRMQSGYFSLDGLGPIAKALKSMATSGDVVKAVVGSNDGATLGSHVEELAKLLAVPRPGAALGVVSFGNGIFHPKTMHIVRSDGTQAAYVGSANVGVSGISGLNIEAGLLLDERDGDPVPELAKVAAAVDAWFAQNRAGIEMVSALADVAPLVASGVLAKVRPPRVTGQGTSGMAGAGARPSLAQLFKLAPVTTPAPVNAAPQSAAAAAVSTALAGYPPTARFAPGAKAPTVGAAALSGVALPNGAVGLVLRLSKDTTRPWQGKDGTANITIPVDALEPIRFGFLPSGTPRAEFKLQARHIYVAGVDVMPVTDTNVNLVGYGPSPTGNKDRRLLFPKAASRALEDAANNRGAALPAPGDYAMLEWPTAARPTFRLTFVDLNTPLYGNLLALVAAATQAKALVGPGGCWLPSGVSPAW